MDDRAMIIVAGGASTRFGSDKLMFEVAGRPLIAHTVEMIRSVVDRCVLVVRSELVDPLQEAGLGVDVVPGGPTRTGSEIAGLRALGSTALIGIHDGARPNPRPSMVSTLFEAAAMHGGAVPSLSPGKPLLRRDTLAVVGAAVTVQTPQVFWGSELRDAYRAVEGARFECHDTADVVHQFTNLEIAVVTGDPDNIKVTYPEDLERLLPLLD